MESELKIRELDVINISEEYRNLEYKSVCVSKCKRKYFWLKKGYYLQPLTTFR